MHLLVLIAGVADPKWPLPASPEPAAVAAHAAQRAILSPFDEAALELALKLRDADPSVTITAVVAGPEPLARKVAEWRLAGVYRFDAGALAPIDARAFAAAFAGALRPLAHSAQLVFAGREFGDVDDGSVPACLAHEIGFVHVALALTVQADAQGWGVTRQRAGGLERRRLCSPALLSVTNDPQNRLRHPLLKNVMAARKLAIHTLTASAAPATLEMRGLAVAPPPARTGPCRMLTGTPDEQAAELADLLTQEGARA